MLNNDVWMPAPGGEPAGYFYFDLPLTPRERAVLRRLRRGDRHGTANPRPGAFRRRAALRRRRRALDRLAPGDLRSLVRIVMELGL